MSYEIHIRRTPPLTLEEWKSIVEQTEGVRLDSAGASLTNPKTGEVISIGGIDGDAQICMDGKWRPFFMWRNSGAVAFRAPRDFDQPTSVVRTLATVLASKLGARLIGDGGEEYA